MLFDPSTSQHLKPWLTKTLEPICDADPEALAEYIQALLKHNAPEAELRKELAAQLEEFLEKECSSFIDMLFTTLRTKSYLPYSAQPEDTPSSSLDQGIPIPLDALMAPSGSASPERSRKRAMEYDERDGRPTKGPRLSHDGQFARNGRGYDNFGYGRGGDRGRRGGMGMGRGGMEMGRGGGMGMMNGMNGAGMGEGAGMNGRVPHYRPPDQRRGICRDYHNNGYCARGSTCKYSHGDDAFVPGQSYPMNGGGPLPFMPMFQNGGVPFNGMGAGPAYDPHDSRIDMRPNGGVGPGARPPRAPVIPRDKMESGAGGSSRSGELPVIQDLTPRDPNDPSSRSNGASLPNGVPTGHPMPGAVDNSMNVDPNFLKTNPDIQMGNSSAHHPMSNNTHHPQSRGYRAKRGGGRGANRAGTFPAEVHDFRPEPGSKPDKRQDKTLVVEKIPEDKLSLENVNGWFKQFGTVTNVAIDPKSQKALVSFSNHEEAHAAWRSEEAVFNNRFVKLFWHRPLEGKGEKGEKMLAASAPLVANMAAKANSAAAAPSTPSSKAGPSEQAPSAFRKASTPSAAMSALAAKQQRLEQQIAEQKALVARLDGASGDEKKSIMARLRKLGEEMTGGSTPSTPPPPSSSNLKGRSSATPRPDDKEQKERERLDKELEMHSATVGSDGGEEETTESLQAKLEKLKAEATSLGIDPSAPDGPSYGSYRGYRGRGRGSRSYYRGATRGGGPARASMKLDNRPKKLVVRDVSEDSLQAVRDWFETTGQVDSVERSDEGDVVVSFKSRGGAEQGLAKGSTIALVGPKEISWVTGQPTHKANTSHLSAESKTDDNGALEGTDDIFSYGRAGSIDLGGGPDEDVIISSGWGGDNDDGMGL